MAEEEIGVLDTIRDLKNREPFVPFRITMTSGDGYLIESADLLALGKSQVIYCLPKSDRVAHLRLNQIATVEEFELKPRRRR
jgi:hypothetical protein